MPNPGTPIYIDQKRADDAASYYHPLWVAFRANFPALDDGDVADCVGEIAYVLWLRQSDDDGQPFDAGEAITSAAADWFPSIDQGAIALVAANLSVLLEDICTVNRG